MTPTLTRLCGQRLYFPSTTAKKARRVTSRCGFYLAVILPDTLLPFHW
jgi:hypothetical protein